MVESRDCLGAFANKSDTGSQVLWVGRPATGQGSNALWEAELTRMIEERQAGPREELHQEEGEDGSVDGEPKDPSSEKEEDFSCDEGQHEEG